MRGALTWLVAMDTPVHNCPFPGCQRPFADWTALAIHWAKKHRPDEGPLEAFLQERERHELREVGSREDVHGQSSSTYTPDTASEHCSEALQVALAQIDAMKFRYYETDASGQRAKNFATSVIASLKPALIAAIQPQMRDGVDLPSLIDPIMRVLDRIGSAKQEATYRRHASAEHHPPLKIYPRELGQRNSATRGKRKLMSGGTAMAYDTKLEEVYEREFA